MKIHTPEEVEAFTFVQWDMACWALDRECLALTGSVATRDWGCWHTEGFLAAQARVLRLKTLREAERQVADLVSKFIDESLR